MADSTETFEKKVVIALEASMKGMQESIDALNAMMTASGHVEKSTRSMGGALKGIGKSVLGLTKSYDKYGKELRKTQKIMLGLRKSGIATGKILKGSLAGALAGATALGVMMKRTGSTMSAFESVSVGAGTAVSRLEQSYEAMGGAAKNSMVSIQDLAGELTKFASQGVGQMIIAQKDSFQKGMAGLISGFSIGKGKEWASTLISEMASSFSDQMPMFEKTLVGDLGDIMGKLDKAANIGDKKDLVKQGKAVLDSLQASAAITDTSLQKAKEALDRIGAQSSMTDPIRDFRDMITRVGNVLENLEKQMTDTFGDDVAIMIKDLSKGLEKGSKHIGEYLKSFATYIKDIITRFNDWGGIQKLIEKIAPTLKFIIDKVIWLGKTFAETGALGKGMMIAIAGFMVSSNVRGLMGGLLKVVGNLASSFVGAEKKGLAFIGSMKGLKTVGGGLAGGIAGSIGGKMAGGAIAKGLNLNKEKQEVGAAWGSVAGAAGGAFAMSGGNPVVGAVAGLTAAIVILTEAFMSTNAALAKDQELIKKAADKQTKAYADQRKKIDVSTGVGKSRKQIMEYEAQVRSLYDELQAIDAENDGWFDWVDGDKSGVQAKLDKVNKLLSDEKANWKALRIGGEADTTDFEKTLENITKDFDKATEIRANLNVTISSDTGAYLKYLDEVDTKLKGLKERVMNRARTGIDTTDIRNQIADLEKLKVTLSDIEKSGPDTSLEQLKEELFNVTQLERQFSGMSGAMANLRSVVETLGPAAMVAGQNIGNMLNAGASKQMTDGFAAMATSAKSIALATKVIAEAGENPDAAAAKATAYQYLEAATAGLATANKAIEESVTNMLAPLEKQIGVVKTITELKKTDLDISQSLYGTPALAVKAQLEIVQLMQQEKNLVKEELSLLQATIAERIANGDVESNLIGLRQKEVELAGRARKISAEQLKNVKSLRDGYIDAVKAMALGSTRFSKIIVTSEKNMMRGLKKGVQKSNFLLGQFGELTERTKAESYQFSEQGMGQLKRTGSGQVMGEEELMKAVYSRANAPGDPAARAAAMEGADLFMKIGKGADNNTSKLLAASKLNSEGEISAIEALGEKLVVRSAAGAALGAGANAAGTTAFGEAVNRLMGGKAGGNLATGFGGVDTGQVAAELKKIAESSGEGAAAAQKALDALQKSTGGKSVPFNAAEYSKFATGLGSDSGTINAMVDYMNQNKVADPTKTAAVSGTKIDISATNIYYKHALPLLTRIANSIDPEGEYKTQDLIQKLAGGVWNLVKSAGSFLVGGSQTSTMGYGRLSSGKTSLDQPPGITNSIDRNLIDNLKRADKQVKRHERSHAATGGKHVKGGGPQYTYRRGPDGKQYAVGGKVLIDVSPIPGDPEGTIEKMQQIRRAALAPRHPSEQDMKVAQTTVRIEERMRQILKGRKEESGMYTGFHSMQLPSHKSKMSPSGIGDEPSEGILAGRSFLGGSSSVARLEGRVAGGGLMDMGPLKVLGNAIKQYAVTQQEQTKAVRENTVVVSKSGEHQQNTVAKLEDALRTSDQAKSHFEELQNRFTEAKAETGGAKTRLDLFARNSGAFQHGQAEMPPGMMGPPAKSAANQFNDDLIKDLKAAKSAETAIWIDMSRARAAAQTAQLNAEKQRLKTQKNIEAAIRSGSILPDELSDQMSTEIRKPAFGSSTFSSLARSGGSAGMPGQTTDRDPSSDIATASRALMHDMKAVFEIGKKIEEAKGKDKSRLESEREHLAKSLSNQANKMKSNFENGNAAVSKVIDQFYAYASAGKELPEPTHSPTDKLAVASEKMLSDMKAVYAIQTKLEGAKGEDKTKLELELDPLTRSLEKQANVMRGSFENGFEAMNKVIDQYYAAVSKDDVKTEEPSKEIVQLDKKKTKLLKQQNLLQEKVALTSDTSKEVSNLAGAKKGSLSQDDFENKYPELFEAANLRRKARGIDLGVDSKDRAGVIAGAQAQLKSKYGAESGTVGREASRAMDFLTGQRDVSEGSFGRSIERLENSMAGPQEALAANQKQLRQNKDQAGLTDSQKSIAPDIANAIQGYLDGGFAGAASAVTEGWAKSSDKKQLDAAMARDDQIFAQGGARKNLPAHQTGSAQQLQDTVQLSAVDTDKYTKTNSSEEEMIRQYGEARGSAIYRQRMKIQETNAKMQPSFASNVPLEFSGKGDVNAHGFEIATGKGKGRGSRGRKDVSNLRQTEQEEARMERLRLQKAEQEKKLRDMTDHARKLRKNGQMSDAQFTEKQAIEGLQARQATEGLGTSYGPGKKNIPERVTGVGTITAGSITAGVADSGKIRQVGAARKASGASGSIAQQIAYHLQQAASLTIKNGNQQNFEQGNVIQTGAERLQQHQSMTP